MESSAMLQRHSNTVQYLKIGRSPRTHDIFYERTCEPPSHLYKCRSKSTCTNINTQGHLGSQKIGQFDNRAKIYP